MMSELIKMSLFCDGEVSSDTVQDTQTDERSPSSYEPEMKSCNGGVALRWDMSHFISETDSARVDLSTFNSLHSDLVVETDYLCALFEMSKTSGETKHPEAASKQDIGTGNSNLERVIRTSKPESGWLKPGKPSFPRPTEISTYICKVGDVTIKRPPYSYRALVCAAMFLLGGDGVTRNEVIDAIKDMFDVFAYDNPVWQRCWQKNVLKSRPWERTGITRDARTGLLKLRYETVAMYMFRAPEIQEFRDNHGYLADNLFAQIGYPELYDELKEKVKRATKELSSESWKQAPKSEQKVVDPAASRSAILKRKSPTKRSNSSTTPSSAETPAPKKARDASRDTHDFTEKCPSLRLPSRPCFNDDASNDSFSLTLTSSSNNTSAHAPSPSHGLPSSLQTPTLYITPTNTVYYGLPYYTVTTFPNGAFQ